MSNSTQKLNSILQNNKKNNNGGITSICSTHPWVLQAAFEYAKKQNSLLLIESTCNQVNHEGGYTHTTPKEFYNKIINMAKQYSFPVENLILGGDHLGPNPWTDLPSKGALHKSAKMVEAYVRAGYKKIHLDTSMSCADDPTPLSNEVISNRAAYLCEIAENTLNDMNVKEDNKCVYVIGTEVPTPGGIREHEELHITKPDDVESVIELTKKSFLEKKLSNAWNRVIAVVVQPGIEFGDNTIIRYNKTKAQELSSYIETRHNDSIIYEAHSTDYQTPQALKNVVSGHFAILKVGPQLTFAMREALFALSHIEGILYKAKKILSCSNFVENITTHIKNNPVYWEKYYTGSSQDIEFAIQFSLSDRIRYYWGDEHMQEFTSTLLSNLNNVNIPPSLVYQYFPCYPIDIPFIPEQAILHTITRVLQNYWSACAYNYSAK